MMNMITIFCCFYGRLELHIVTSVTGYEYSKLQTVTPQ